MAKEWKDRINIDPGLMGGKPVIKGTRVPLEIIVGGLAGGDRIEEICEGYSITEPDVRAALAYAADMLRSEPVFATTPPET